ncbi:MAG: hypothetical protein LC772_08215 [Chloroflexi bacterium]|nr:hypothetical protein [Chloroflexota bacterium]
MNEIIYAFTAGSIARVPKEQLLPQLKSAGFDGVEIPVHPDFIGLKGVNDFAGLVTLLKNAGLSAPAVSTFWCDPLQNAQAAGMDGVLLSAGVLGRMLGSRVGVVRTAQATFTDAKEARKDLSGALIAALNHFDPAGLAVAVELARGDVLGGYSAAMDWLYLGHPDVGVAMDTASFAERGADPYRSAVELGKLVRIVYLTEPLDSSRFSAAELFSGLKAAKFTGPLALRPASLDTASTDAARLREVWTSAPVEQAAITES